MRVLALAILCLGAVGFAPSAEAQSAHFSGAVGSGFNQPSGVAVDASGNLFMADSSNNAVKEILAVNGIIPPTTPSVYWAAASSSPRAWLWTAAVMSSWLTAPTAGSQRSLRLGGSIPAITPIMQTLGSGFTNPFGVAVDGSGSIRWPAPTGTSIFLRRGCGRQRQRLRG
jgi:DNA-binding beta-propeller fold protein YncE